MDPNPIATLANNAVHGGANLAIETGRDPRRGRPGVSLEWIRNPPPIKFGPGLVIFLAIVIIDLILLGFLISKVVQGSGC